MSCVRVPRKAAGFGGFVYRLRQARGLSAKALAIGGGFNQERLLPIETVTVSPRLQTVQALARGFGMKTSEFVELFEADEAKQRAGK